MLKVSFRSLPSAPFPRLRGGKPALVGLAAALIVLAGCGGGGHKASADLRTVAGGGYRFSVPSSWSVHRGVRQVTATSGRVDLVGVNDFTLARPYRPPLWAKAVPALNRTAAGLAAQLGGEVRTRATVVIAGNRARQYEINYKGLVERTAFVLAGRREFQLLCRFERGGDDGACRTLFSSFRLG
jgi:hypothetical protein